MAAAWSPEFAARVREWCDHVAAMGVDVLADAGLVTHADFERARDIVAEEVFVRLCLHDYPPTPEPSGQAADAELGAAPATYALRVQDWHIVPGLEVVCH